MSKAGKNNSDNDYYPKTLNNLTVKFKSHTYGHQQFWTLVRALVNSNFTVSIECRYAELYECDIQKQNRFTVISGRGKTPWIALVRAVETANQSIKEGKLNGN